ncbi:MAG: methyltransferase domain-containing protein [Caulobacter sp.]|nr:methyltransferase domain-containing protein [Caulobacter sp.]
MTARRPRAIAEQARHARGLLGRIIAFIMARETWAANRRTIDALAITDRDQILDIGCGHGRSLGALAARAPNGKVVGVDPSELMVKIAARRNRRLAKVSRVAVRVAGADDLPFPDGGFDRALCVHVVYFWRQLEGPLREVARVLKPGGRLALYFRTSADAAAVAAFPADVYRFPSLEEMLAALEAAGFGIESLDTSGAGDAGPVLLVALRR